MAMVVALIAALAAMVVAGCGGSTTGSTSTGGGSGAGKDTAGKRLRIIQVAAAPASEPFSSVAASGLAQAGKDFNLDTLWRGPEQPNPSDPTEEGRLIENAIASHPDGLVIADVYPNQFNPLIKQATDKGIPVILASIGAQEVDKVGALTFVGNDELASGRLSGEQMQKLGDKHALVIGLPPGVPAFDQRVQGFKEGFAPGKVTVLEVPLTDINDTVKVRNLIEIALQKDSSIDSVWPIGTGIGAPVLAAYDALGAKAKQLHWGQLGVDAPTIQALQQGKYSFTTDQQQFLQGYLPAMYLSLYLRYGIKPVERVTPTGPTLVLPADANRLATLNANRIR